MNLRCTALACLLLAACATPGTLDEARKRYDEGRGEEALEMLAREMQRNPRDAQLRGEYFRLRDVLAGQWLAQAEVLRQAGQFDAAESLYRRVQAHDPGNSRAAAGLAYTGSDRRHSSVVASAERLVREGRHAEAQELLRPVLTENPQHREARRLQRVVEDRLAAPASTDRAVKPRERVASALVSPMPRRSRSRPSGLS